jgi:hypothetical protein
MRPPNMLLLVLVRRAEIARRHEPVQQRPFCDWWPVDTGARRYGDVRVGEDGIVHDLVETGRGDVDEFDAAATVSGAFQMRVSAGLELETQLGTYGHGILTAWRLRGRGGC